MKNQNEKSVLFEETKSTKYLSCFLKYDNQSCIFKIDRHHDPKDDIDKVLAFWFCSQYSQENVYTIHDDDNILHEGQYISTPYDLDNFDCPIKNISISNIEGKPIVAFVIQYFDTDYDYGKGEGIHIIGIYQCDCYESIKIS